MFLFDMSCDGCGRGYKNSEVIAKADRRYGVPSPSETRESALVQVSEAMALLIRMAETSTKPATTAVGPSCGMQNCDAMQVKRNKNMSSRCNVCRQRARIHVTRGAGEDRQKAANVAKTKAKN